MDSKKSNKTVKQTANLQLVKETNLTLIFNLIYKYRPVSRAELAKITKLSPTTVSSLVEELLHKKLVIETGFMETGKSGRKAVLVDINESGRYVVSVELVEDGICCFFYNLLCKKAAGKKYLLGDFSNVGNEIIKAVEATMKEENIPEESLVGINIGVPGLIDYSSGRIISSTVISISGDNDFFSKVKERFTSIPVILDNESSFCAYAEKEFGLGSSVRQLIYIEVNVGIGAGIILDGRIYRGSFGLAGEIGHTTIDMNGPKCKCGNRGCLEQLASVPALIQKAVFAIMSGRETAVKSLINNDLNKISIGVIGTAAEMGDELSLEVIGENAAKLASGINNVINMYNPQTVVIGGEITKLGGVFLEKLQACLEDISLKPVPFRTNIVYSKLDDNPATLGGARYMLDNIFNPPGLLTGALKLEQGMGSSAAAPQ